MIWTVVSKPQATGPPTVWSDPTGKEGSFYTVRELFSPIHIEMRELPEDFAGRIEIANRFNFTNTNQCGFRWELVTFRGPDDKQPGHTGP